MLSSQKGSPDGRKVNWYKEGQVYDDLPLPLTVTFLREGWAVEVKDLPPVELPKVEYAPPQRFRSKAKPN